MNAFGRAEPIHWNTQLGERLFQNPGFARLALDPHGPVGNAAPQNRGARLLAGRDAAGAPQVSQQRRSFFDIECVRQRRLPYLWPWLRRRSLPPPGTWSAL